MSYAALERQLRSLPEEYLDEISRYVEFLQFRQKKEAKSKTDLSGYFGCLKDLPDGLELQRSMRDELR